MRKGFVFHIIGVILLLAITVAGRAQTYVGATANKDSILIGEPVQLTLEAIVPEGTKVSWFSIDSIPHLEIVDRGKIDTMAHVDGRRFVQTLVITGYDSGHWEVPTFQLQAAGKNYNTNALPLNVYFTRPFDAAQDYHDIKDIIEHPYKMPWYLPWLIGLGVLLVAALIWFLVKRSRKKETAPPAVPERILSPYEEAMEALQQLQQAGVPQETEVKKYYTQLNDILRVYVKKQWHITSQEKTNEELLVQMQRLPVSRELLGELTNVLRMSDYVKFARYQPDTTVHAANLLLVKKAIEQLHQSRPPEVPVLQKQ